MDINQWRDGVEKGVQITINEERILMGWDESVPEGMRWWMSMNEVLMELTGIE